MSTSRTYTPEQRAEAVANYQQLLAQGLSLRQARAETGQRFGVNPSSLRTWVERGVVWSPGGRSDLAADVERLSQEVADLRSQLAQAQRRLEIVADIAAHFDLAGHLPESVLVEEYVEHLAGRFSPAEVAAVLAEVLSFRLGAAGLVDDVETEPTAEDLADAYAANQIWDQWVQNYRCYGADRLHRWLKSCGSELGRREVSRLMKLCGASALSYQSSVVTIAAVGRPKGSGRRPSRWPVPKELNSFWGIDICPVKVGVDDYVVLFVVDVTSRRVVGFSIRPLGPVVDVHATFSDAVKTRCKNSLGSAGPTGESGIRLSAVTSSLPSQDLARLTGSKDDAIEKAVMQTVGRLFQIEVTERFGSGWVARTDLSEAVGSWVTWYNTVRLQKALGYRTPVEFERSLGVVC